MNKEIEELLKELQFSPSFLKDIGNGILLNEEEENILKQCGINYKNCMSVEELIFKIEDYLNDSYLENNELEQLSNRLSEYHYYMNTNK